MVSISQNTSRPLPFKYPIYSNLRRSYTFSDFISDFQRLIDRNIADLSVFLRLHWRIWGGRWPQIRQNRHSAQRPVHTFTYHAPLQIADLCDSLNKTGVISPRYNVRITDFEKWVVKLLPSRQFGYIVLTTSAGIMDHEEARRKHVAGKIIG